MRVCVRERTGGEGWGFSERQHGRLLVCECCVCKAGLDPKSSHSLVGMNTDILLIRVAGAMGEVAIGNPVLGHNPVLFRGR